MEEQEVGCVAFICPRTNVRTRWCSLFELTPDKRSVRRSVSLCVILRTKGCPDPRVTHQCVAGRRKDDERRSRKKNQNERKYYIKICRFRCLSLRISQSTDYTKKIIKMKTILATVSNRCVNLLKRKCRFVTDHFLVSPSRPSSFPAASPFHILAPSSSSSSSSSSNRAETSVFCPPLRRPEGSSTTPEGASTGSTGGKSRSVSLF